MPLMPKDNKTCFTNSVEEQPSISMHLYELAPERTPIPVAEFQK